MEYMECQKYLRTDCPSNRLKTTPTDDSEDPSQKWAKATRCLAKWKSRGEIVMRSLETIGSDVIHDVRSGLTASQLMIKYELSPKQVMNVFKQLEDGMPRPADIYPRSWSINSKDHGRRTRSLPRHDVNVPLLVHEMQDTRVRGLVLDISEKGLRIHGMEAIFRRERNLTIRSEEIFGIRSVMFLAECRWVKKNGSHGHSFSGFEIVEIVPQHHENLKKLVGLIGYDLGMSRTAFESADETSDRKASADHTMNWKCPACGMPQSRKFQECPQCGVIVYKYIRQRREIQTDSVVIDIDNLKNEASTAG
jgi:hypothetical protein